MAVSAGIGLVVGGIADDDVVTFVVVDDANEVDENGTVVVVAAVHERGAHAQVAVRFVEQFC